MLDVSQNLQLTDESLVGLRDITTLKCLKVRKNLHFDGTFLAHVHPNLEQLQFAFNPNPKNGLVMISRLTNLTCLNLSHLAADSECARGLLSLSKIRYLDISCNTMDLLFLRSLQTLEVLHLRNLPISDEEFEALNDLSNLTSLNLSHFQFTNVNDKLERALERCPTLLEKEQSLRIVPFFNRAYDVFKMV